MRSSSLKRRARLSGAAFLVSAMSLAVMPPAGASPTFAASCTGALTLTFTPPLTLGQQTGTYRSSFAGTCVSGSYDPLVTASADTFELTFDYRDALYTGTCALALLEYQNPTQKGQLILVGGTALTGYAVSSDLTSAFTNVGALVPSGANCPFSSTSGVIDVTFHQV